MALPILIILLPASLITVCCVVVSMLVDVAFISSPVDLADAPSGGAASTTDATTTAVDEPSRWPITPSRSSTETSLTDCHPVSVPAPAHPRKVSTPHEVSSPMTAVQRRWISRMRGNRRGAGAD